MRFEAPFGDQGQRLANTVHLRLVGKLMVDFLFVLIELSRYEGI